MEETKLTDSRKYSRQKATDSLLFAKKQTQWWSKASISHKIEIESKEKSCSARIPASDSKCQMEIRGWVPPPSAKGGPPLDEGHGLI